MLWQFTGGLSSESLLTNSPMYLPSSSWLEIDEEDVVETWVADKQDEDVDDEVDVEAAECQTLSTLRCLLLLLFEESAYVPKQDILILFWWLELGMVLLLLSLGQMSCSSLPSSAILMIFLLLPKLSSALPLLLRLRTLSDIETLFRNMSSIYFCEWRLFANSQLCSIYTRRTN